MKRFIITSAALMLGACSGASSETEFKTASQDATAPSVLISEGYVLAPLKGRDIAAGYFIAENQGAATSLIRATSPMAIVEIHTHTLVDGVMKMRKVDTVDLPEETSIAFEPGGFHLMMFGFSPAEGQIDAPVTLTLSTGEDLVVSLPIRARG